MSRRPYCLTFKEEELLDLLWTADRPMTATEILSDSQGHSWSDNYLPIMLKSLLNRKVLEVCGYVQSGTQYARQFRCRFTREEYVARMIIERGLKIEKLSRAFVELTKQMGIEKGDAIRELEDALKELKEN